MTDSSVVIASDDDDAPVFSLDREREHKREIADLEARCASLERQLSSRGALRPAHSDEVEHTITRCGFHPQVVVTQEPTNKVFCAICKTELSAIDVLRQFANRERNFIYGMEAARRESRDLKDEIEKLKRIRQNLRAQVKRARVSIQKDGGASVDGDDLPVATGS